MNAPHPVVQVGYKATAYLSSLTDDDVRAMPPARRAQLEQWCAHWAARVKQLSGAEPKSGVLFDLKAGARID
jgi:hypothetical protein